MTFHDKRLRADRKVQAFRRKRLMKEGALTLNLWNAMPVIAVGTAADDWRTVGVDLRNAINTYADECG